MINFDTRDFYSLFDKKEQTIELQVKENHSISYMISNGNIYLRYLKDGKAIGNVVEDIESKRFDLKHLVSLTAKLLGNVLNYYKFPKVYYTSPENVQRKVDKVNYEQEITFYDYLVNTILSYVGCDIKLIDKEHYTLIIRKDEQNKFENIRIFYKKENTFYQYFIKDGTSLKENQQNDYLYCFLKLLDNRKNYFSNLKTNEYYLPYMNEMAYEEIINLFTNELTYSL